MSVFGVVTTIPSSHPKVVYPGFSSASGKKGKFQHTFNDEKDMSQMVA